ncbi:MAG: Ig-like domain-containing protein [Victivallaceae bacterium]|nr:Ig-like domain-containing protein [Victivallaceae bacterium]
MKSRTILVFLISVLPLMTFGAKKRPAAGNLRSVKYAVMVSAKVQVKPPQIALAWSAEKCFSYTIYRRFAGEKSWNYTPIATLKGDATGYVDKKVQPEVKYEYRIDRIGKGFIGRGYITCGIEIPLTEQRGTVILVVDRSIVPGLEAELKRLELDMVGDGWEVIRHDVERDAKVTVVKKLIVDDYNQAPEQVRTVFLFGHILVPYSGDIYPDGHLNHRGAWPSDLYYGDMDNAWQDKKTHKYFDRGNQKNIPGDGKFDRSTVVPNSIELEVGRVDLANMTLFKLSETELLRQYLNKDHFFRHNVIKAEQRALVDDNFGSFRGEAFGSSAWRNFPTFFTAEKVKAADFIPTLYNQSYLWAYGNGGGSNQSAGGIGTTQSFVDQPPKAVFTMLFGSYFGDWNHPNNFMRAPLASSGYALTSAWDGRPHWYIHHMALGKTIGYSTLRTQNNHPFQDYLACNDAKSSVSGKDEDSEWDYNPIHVALMGDPTLRLHPVEPPRAIQLTKQAKPGKKAALPERSTSTKEKMQTTTGLKLSWVPVSAKNLIGYHVYSAVSLKGPFKRLTKAPVTATEFIIESAKDRAVYAVKTIVLTTAGSGSYFNSSQAVFAKLPTAGNKYQSLKLGNQKLVIKEDRPLSLNIKPLSGNDKVLLWSTPYKPDNGQLKAGKNSDYVYTPKLNYFGREQLTIVANDGLNDSNPAIIDIGIQPVADRPLAMDEKTFISGSKQIKLTLSAIDPDDKNQALTYTITEQPKQGKLTGTPPNVTYHIATRLAGNDTFKFTASDGKLTSKPATVTITPPTPCPKISKAKKIDGKLNDWGKLPIVCKQPEEFRIDGKSAWSGIKDNQFSIGTAYDDKYLYVAVKVTDDEYNSVKGKSPWDQDGIEIRLDARLLKIRSANRGKGEMKDFLFFAFSPNKKPNAPWLYKTKKKHPEGTKFACIKTQQGFNTEIAIPLSYLVKQGGKEWDGFRLNVCVDDKDKDGLVQIWWKPDWRHGNSYYGSGSFGKY